MGRGILLLGIGISVLVAWAITGPLADKDPPTLPEYYWGPKAKEGQKEDTSIRPFKINVQDKVLNDLKKRLELELSEDGNRLTPPLEGIQFQYGFNTKALTPITSYWLNKYDWRAREKLLNRYPQFMTSIAGIDIHFQHVKSVSKKAYKTTRPLLLIHGWPGSIVEFQKVIPLLTDPEGDTNYELVIPSLPGFAFSEKAHRPGLGPVEVAQIFQKLMSRLGYDKYYVQGGDWGGAIATNIASLYPNNVMALHLNFCSSRHSKTFMRMLIGSLYPSYFMAEEDIPRMYPLSKRFSELIVESGYFHIQATKPDTIGVALSNSPSGYAAYVLEKFSTGTNLAFRDLEDGGFLSRFNIDELLDNIMVYWVTNSVTTSIRLYAEALTHRERRHGVDNVPVKAPTGCLFLPNELLNLQNEYFLQDKFHNLVSFTRGKEGGHFAAAEVPKIFAEDVLNFLHLVESKK